jgi:hypothetical protein
MNKGNALRQLNRLDEALAACDASIAIVERLVEAGRSELENDLGAALMNKGMALEQTRQLLDAFESYSHGIAIWERHFLAGESYLAADLIKAYWVRFDLCRQVQQWPVAAGDILRPLSVYSAVSEAGELTIPVQREVTNFTRAFHRLSSEEQEQLYAALGENADAIRRLLERPTEK